MPTVEKLKGSALLKVVGIIMIIYGVITVVSGLVSIGSGPMLASMFGLDEVGVRYYTIMGSISMITGAVELVFGIFGVRFCKDAGKAGFLIIVGIIQVVITAFSMLYNYALTPMAERVNQQMMDSLSQMTGAASADALPNAALLSGSIASIVLGFGLPALYILGAFLNRLPMKKEVEEINAQTIETSDVYGQQIVEPVEPYAAPTIETAEADAQPTIETADADNQQVKETSDSMDKQD